MRNVATTGHFAAVIANANKHNATHISIQDYWTFCNFKTQAEADAFNQWAAQEDKTTQGVNTQRPYVPFEVAVRHPGR